MLQLGGDDQQQLAHRFTQSLPDCSIFGGFSFGEQGTFLGRDIDHQRKMGCHGNLMVSALLFTKPLPASARAQVARWRCLSCLSRPATRVHPTGTGGTERSVVPSHATAYGKFVANTSIDRVWPYVVRVGMIILVTGGLLWIIGSDTTLMAITGTLISFGAGLLITGSANEDVNVSIFSKNRGATVSLVLAALAVTSSNSRHAWQHMPLAIAVWEVSPCLPCVYCVARWHRVLARTRGEPAMTTLIACWSGLELLRPVVRLIYLMSQNQGETYSKEYSIIIALHTVAGMTQFFIWRTRGLCCFAACVNAYLLSTGIVLIYRGVYPELQWDRATAAQAESESSVALGVALAVPNALLLWRHWHMFNLLQVVAKTNLAEEGAHGRRKGSISRAVHTYASRRRKEMRALRAAWCLVGFAMRLVGTVLFVLHGMLLLQGNASHGAVLATGTLCRAISISLIVASKQDVNWFGHSGHRAWIADLIIFVCLAGNFAWFLLCDRSPVFVVCLIPAIGFSMERNSVVIQKGVLSCTSYISLLEALSFLCAGTWAFSRYGSGAWQAGLLVGIICLWLPLLVLSMHCAFARRWSALSVFRWSCGMQPITESLVVLLCGFKPPPNGFVRPGHDKAWVVAGCAGLLVSAAGSLLHHRVILLAANRFEKAHNAEDRKFVSDLLKRGGAVEGAAHELLEMTRTGRTVLSQEAVKLAADAIRADSAEQRAYIQASQNVRQALNSSDAHRARAQLHHDCHSMLACALQRDDQQVSVLFHRLRKLSNAELARLDELMVTCRTVFERTLAVRWKQLAGINSWTAPRNSHLQSCSLDRLSFWGTAPQPAQRLSLLMSEAQGVNDHFQEHVANLVHRFNQAKHPVDLDLDCELSCLPLRNDALLESDDVAEARPGPLKQRARAEDKVKTDYATNDIPEAHLLDLVRVQVKVYDPFAAFAFYKFVEADEKLHVVRIKNKFAHDFVPEADQFGHKSEYKDLLLNVRFKDDHSVDHVCEIQVTLTQLAEMKKQAHKVSGTALSSPDLDANLTNSPPLCRSCKFYKVSRAANAGELFCIAGSLKACDKPPAPSTLPRTASHGDLMQALNRSLLHSSTETRLRTTGSRD